MTEHVSKSISEIRSKAPELHAATDEAAKIVARVEKFLNEECSVGIPVSVYAHTDADGNDMHLEYTRINGKYRIAVVLYPVLRDEEGHEILCNGHPEHGARSYVAPWAEASRHEKLVTFNCLAELLNQLSAKIRDVTEAARESSKTVEAVLAGLDGETRNHATAIADQRATIDTKSTHERTKFAMEETLKMFRTKRPSQ